VEPRAADSFNGFNHLTQRRGNDDFVIHRGDEERRPTIGDRRRRLARCRGCDCCRTGKAESPRRVAIEAVGGSCAGCGQCGPIARPGQRSAIARAGQTPRGAGHDLPLRRSAARSRSPGPIIGPLVARCGDLSLDRTDDRDFAVADRRERRPVEGMRRVRVVHQLPLRHAQCGDRWRAR